MHPIKTPLYQTQQIRELERLAKERLGISEQVLMQRAGKAAFEFLPRRWPHARRVALFCGTGNNGGDGYHLALLLHERGLQITIWQVGDPKKLQGEARNAYQACLAAPIPIFTCNEKIDLQHPDVIVDAICGIGLKSNLRDEALIAIKKIQHTKLPILSLDIPTGIDADTGQVYGRAIQATATITFMGLKLGLLTGSGIAYTGELVLNDLQLPSDLFSHITPVAEKIHLSTYANYLKSRPRDWHKGLSGHVLVIGGSNGFSGAPRMAGMAALRVGAGLVSIATHPMHAEIMNATCPELMCHGINEQAQLQPLLAKANVIVLGPGLAQTDWSKMVWEYGCHQDLPLVLDADGLNLLAQNKSLFENKAHENWVLTPHPAEAARLLNETTLTVQQDRLKALKALNKYYGSICVLKGAGSLVLAPNSLPALCDKGNPGMSSAGMGDILSGVIAGLIAQGIPPGDAAKLGIYMHARAGDLAAKEGERGIIATDLLPYLHRLANHSVD